jgi:hemolysin D
MMMLTKLKGLLKNGFSRKENGWTKEETEFLPAALEVVEANPSKNGRIILWTLIVMIISVLAWAFCGSIDEVAVAQGKLIPTGNVKILQAEDKGVVKAILVKDGDKVQRGQPLIELDTTIAAADLARIRKEIASYRLEMDRLLAEQEGRPFIPQKYPGLEERDLEFQLRLYQSRLFEYQTKLASATAGIMQNQASLDSARSSYAKTKALYEIAKEREAKVAKLVAQDVVADFVLLDYREKRLEMEKELVEQADEIERLKWMLKQSRDTEENIRAGRIRDINDKLVEDGKALQADMEELKKAEEKIRLACITAPIDGRVSQLSVHTVGGVVTAAEPLLEVVPEDAKLQVEAWVANKDIGFIKKGQKAAIKIETFNFQRYGTLTGEVAEISPDAVDDKAKGRVYRVLLNLDQTLFFVNGQNVCLAPGMTATGEIKIKKKKIIDYFLDTFRKYRSEALRER